MKIKWFLSDKLKNSNIVNNVYFKKYYKNPLGLFLEILYKNSDKSIIQFVLISDSNNCYITPPYFELILNK